MGVMDKRTVHSAHARIDGIEPRVTKLEAEMTPMQKSLQRVENILIGSAGAIILMLATVLMRM
jgi:tetrahydromethanopterin S-methyltransferase subunit G